MCSADVISHLLDLLKVKTNRGCLSLTPFGLHLVCPLNYINVKVENGLLSVLENAQSIKQSCGLDCGSFNYTLYSDSAIKRYVQKKILARKANYFLVLPSYIPSNYLTLQKAKKCQISVKFF